MIRLYKAQSEALEKARERGASVRLLTSISTENSGVANELSKILEVRTIDKPLGADFVSVDTRELVVVDSKPDDLRTDRGSDLAIWTTNKLLVDLYEQLFERVWAASQEMQAVRAKSR